MVPSAHNVGVCHGEYGVSYCLTYSLPCTNHRYMYVWTPLHIPMQCWQCGKSSNIGSGAQFKRPP